MLTRFTDMDRSFGWVDELHRRMNRVFEDFDRESAVPYEDAFRGRASFPRVNVFDTTSALVVEVEVPGMKDNDVKIALDQDVLTIAGERKPDVPEGYSVHRRERVQAKFSRSFSLPCKVDAETTTASLQNGILTISLPKAPEARPRQISVKAQ